MAEINQKLGFDAAQAIATLNQLEAALSGVNTQLRAMNKAANSKPPAVIQGFAQTAASAKQAEAAVNSAGNALQNTGKKGTAAGNAITVSWQSMLRIVQTQLLFSALNSLIGLFTKSADAAQKFQLQVAQISAISSGPGSSVDALTESLRKLSVQLGVSIESVGEGAFEALQNDLGTTKETMDFLGGSVSKLSILFGSDLKSAVNTVSPILKAYNLDISEADRISDLLFTTIKTGVITMDELSSQLGKTVPFATQLGVSLEDLLSSIAAITLQGTDAATAQTQFRNILIKLIKPTESLQAAFEKLGVSTGQELVAKFGGTTQALKALFDSVNNSEEAIARMFNTTRGAAGALNLLANAGSEQERIFKEMAESIGIVNAEFEKFDATPARRAQKATEQLNDTIRQLGNTTLEIKTQFLEAFNGIVQNAEDAKIALAGVGIAIAGLGVAALIAMPALLIPAAIIAGVAALVIGVLELKHAWEAIVPSVASAQKAQQDAIKAAKEAADEAAVEQTRTLAKEIAARNELSSEYLKKVTDDYNKDVAAFDRRSADITQSQKNLVDNFEAVLKDASSKIADFARDSQKAVEDQSKKTADALQRLKDFDFEKDLSKKSGRSQAFALEEKAANDLKAALDALKKADASGSTTARENAQAQVEAAIKTAERAEQVAKQEQLLGKAKNAEELQRTALKALSESEIAQEKKVTAAHQAGDAATVASAQAAFDKLAELAKKRAALETEREGRKTTDDRKAEIDRELKDVQKEAGETLAKISSSSFLQNLDLVKPIQEAVKALDQGFNALELEGQFNLANLQQQLDNNNFTAQVQAIVTQGSGNSAVDNAISDATAGAGANANPAAVLKAQQQAMEQLLATNIKNTAEFAKQSAVISSGNALVAELTNTISNAPGFTFLSKQFQQVVTDVQTLAPQISAATGAQITILEGRLDTLKLRVESLFQQGLITEGTKEKLLASLTAIEESIAARKVQLPLEPQIDPAAETAARQKLQDIMSAEAGAELKLLDKTQVDAALQPVEQGAKETFNQVGTDAKAAGGKVGTEFQSGSTTAQTALAGINPVIASISGAPAIAQMNAIAAAAQRALALAQAAAAAGAGQSQHHGGPIFRAQGGPIGRGVDTRMVAMQPGEFVVNKKSSSKFFSQLQAINAGQAPQFREQGGPVTNIGDINVSVNSASGQETSGRDIAIALRRELRRETSKLF